MSLLVLGGARSGKSHYARTLAEENGASPVFVATGQAWDEEMRARIAAHVAERDARWETREAPYDLTAALHALAGPARVVLVDCLTLWLSNLMLRGDDADAACSALASLVPRLAGPVVFVSNEVGQGVVPETGLGRRFRDAQGRLNQDMARACEAVVLVTAGLPRRLKPAEQPPLRLGGR